MKVEIGKYTDRMRCDWHTDYMRKKYGFDWDDSTTRFERFLEKVEDIIQWIYNHSINLYLDSKLHERKIKVHIDPWDTWSMDNTLAYVVVPMLKQLKETLNGAPHVDYDDVPEELRPNEEEIAKYNSDGATDDNFFKRWEWVLGEMIFAFESKINDWEEQFYSGEIDVYSEKLSHGTCEIKCGPKDTFKIDQEGRRFYQERISNGFRLFGKYYEGLWD